MENAAPTAFEYDSENETRFQDLLTKYPTKQAVVIPALWLGQNQYGYLSPEVMDYVANRLEQSPVSVYSVVEFYTMFHTSPPGEHHIQMCHTLTCDLLGCESLTALIKDRLDIGPGEKTKDGKFSFETVECLGSCGTAPMMRMDNQYFENLTTEKLDKIIAACNEGRNPAEANG